ncbi:phosphatase PAP2 family protein [Glycomyces arizonensis]|uniref:phosphatase PAP2 family protein n=1 Tax=Glycomyces arizonensis TaxID=256035 RepID=UPI000402CD68|nr:phosphatase PAP2 family protein [Glycomyces arizonensis]
MLPREFPKPRLAVPAAAAMLLAVLAVALWVRADPASPPFQGLDDDWLRLMGGPHDGLPWAAAEAFNHGGGRFSAVALMVLAVVLTAVRRWRSALFAITAFLATYAVTEVFKHIADRPRPDSVMVTVTSQSFPSGHSSRAACVVVLLAVVAIPVAARYWWWAVGALLVLSMMWARTWQHAHWLTDTLGGVATGLGVTLLCWWAFGTMLRLERSQRSAREPDDLARTGEVPSATSGLPLRCPPARPSRGNRCPPSPHPTRSSRTSRPSRPPTPIRRHRRTATRTRRWSRSGPTTAWRSPRWSSASSAPATRSASSA